MKVQNIIPQQQNNKPNFTSSPYVAGNLFLRFLDTNQAWGANCVDLCSMVIPRTTVDFVNRGPEAGTETARRESMGTFNHSMIGVYGSLAGAFLAASINRKFGIKAHKIFADNDTFETITKSFEANKSNYKSHFKEIFSTLETQVDGVWKKISKDDVEILADKFDEAMRNKQAPELINKDLKNYAKALITSSTGSENAYRFAGSENTLTLSSVIENIYNITKANINKLTSADFLKSMKKMNIGRSVVGLGIATAVGMSTQPINMYLTKKKTGSDGFVGVAGREKDKSAGFKLLKLGGAAAFALGAISTITRNPKNLMHELQFKGLIPTVPQLKFVYGLTIASRLLSARDKDEFRESLVKDTLGFLNLLVLGTVVSKGVARAFDKTLINVGKDGSKNFFKWLTNSSLKTRDEVLYTAPEVKRKAVEAIKNGKVLKFKELLKFANKQTKHKLFALNVAQLAGYLYSGLVLGFGVPKLNIYMTNKSEAKRKARLAEKEVQQPKTTFDTMMQPENLAFLSKNM